MDYIWKLWLNIIINKHRKSVTGTSPVKNDDGEIVVDENEIINE